ncbi:hypothetical protein [Aneurinibacillus migulanus]|uniref:hypothetical protein n=1 Tax=Aneurinibacillus migulanus TaxID=47500 RepID=UPI00209F5E2C|nr:hypothetical protein [Aneurinibacillus migulanus]MCP1355055.1 hypothetical protein [Aneurinibacillus migulanus]
MKTKINPYNAIVIVGRNLISGHEYTPEQIIGIVDFIDKKLKWKSVDEFFEIFPPIKRYKNDGIWDYHSTLEMRRKRLGERFTGNDFKMLIMTTCYENKYLSEIGFAWMIAVSELSKRTTGKSTFERFINDN